jgi:hypothetical protein
MKFTVIWDIAPCSHFEVHLRSRGAYCLHHKGALMMEAVRTSETLVNFTVTTRRYIEKDFKIHMLSFRCAFLSYIFYSSHQSVTD